MKINNAMKKENSSEEVKQVMTEKPSNIQSECGKVVEQQVLILKDIGSSPGSAAFDFDSLSES